jgi:hypothetical protein
MPYRPSQRLYELGRRHEESERKTPRTLPKDLLEPEKITRPSRPLGREVTEAEAKGYLEQIFKANPHFAITHRNIDLVMKTWLNDYRLSIQHTLEDMVQAFKIAEAEHRLDKTPKPDPPKFPDEPGNISTGEERLPLDASPAEMRRASLQQVKDLTDRLKRYEVWKQEQVAS